MEGDYVLIHTGQISMLSTEDSKNIFTSKEGDNVLIHRGQVSILSTEDSKNTCHLRERWLCIDPYMTNKYAIYWR